MARKIIIIERIPGNDLEFRYALWADVPSARQVRYANPNATSVVVDATAGELDSLRTGAVVERVGSARWPSNTTNTAAQTFLEAQFAAFQDEVTNSNPWQRTGSYWDGTTWTMRNNG